MGSEGEKEIHSHATPNSFLILTTRLVTSHVNGRRGPPSEDTNFAVSRIFRFLCTVKHHKQTYSRRRRQLKMQMKQS